MAQKKITDLQLRSGVEDDLNFPGDDGIQTYRVTALQVLNYILSAGRITSTMLNSSIFNSLTAVTPADNDYFPLIDTSDSNATKKGLVGSFKNSAYRSVTATDTATAADEVLLLSGASFTQTLPANGTSGKRLKIIHGGSNFTQVYTLNTAGGATIGGIASGVYKLCTTGEVLELIDNGTNWIITNHHAKTGWISMGSNVIKAVAGGTDPVAPTTSVNSWELRRDGKVVWSRHNLTFSAAGSRSSGSGEYLFKGAPTGYTIDANYTTATRNWNVAWLNLADGQACGGGGDASAQFFGLAVPYDATQFRVFANSQSGQSGVISSSSAFPLGNDNINYHFLAQFPLVELQP